MCKGQRRCFKRVQFMISTMSNTNCKMMLITGFITSKMMHEIDEIYIGISPHVEIFIFDCLEFVYIF